jgi:hypothetical protein
MIKRLISLVRTMEGLLEALVLDEDMREIYKEFIDVTIKQKASALPFSWSKLKPTDLLDYNAIETLAFHLSLQLAVLENLGYSLLFWQASDILVVNKGEFYLLANLAQRVPLYKKEPSMLYLIYPTVFPFPSAQCAPEVLKMAALPFITPRSASYYSLALLCLELLKRYNLSLDLIPGTKLFYFIERCLKEEPSERRCLWL